MLFTYLLTICIWKFAHTLSGLFVQEKIGSIFSVLTSSDVQFSSLRFRSFIHCKLVFALGEVRGFISYFCTQRSSFPTIIYWRDCPFSCSGFSLFIKDWFVIHAWINFWISIVSFTCCFIFELALSSFHYNGILVCL